MASQSKRIARPMITTSPPPDELDLATVLEERAREARRVVDREREQDERDARPSE